MKKRYLSLVLVLTMLLTCVPYGVFADGGEDEWADEPAAAAEELTQEAGTAEEAPAEEPATEEAPKAEE